MKTLTLAFALAVLSPASASTSSVTVESPVVRSHLGIEVAHHRHHYHRHHWHRHHRHHHWHRHYRHRHHWHRHYRHRHHWHYRFGSAVDPVAPIASQTVTV